ncbi:hypothetical protein CC2G_009341 [Coprinopsis cinerea AmutBmut pab1-1]|nr:hypothetical protein CC2G_009341 [Coprinopsis cinerea AmutBmut pab1-1]
MGFNGLESPEVVSLPVQAQKHRARGKDPAQWRRQWPLQVFEVQIRVAVIARDPEEEVQTSGGWAAAAIRVGVQAPPQSSPCLFQMSGLEESSGSLRISGSKAETGWRW